MAKKGSNVIFILVVAIVIVTIALVLYHGEMQCNPDYDINGDGTINFQDCLVINAHITAGDPYNADYDVNCDGVIDQTDVDLVWENKTT